MKFSMRKPCADCPFRRSRRFPLRRARMIEIVDSVRQGSCFPCHKTAGGVYAEWRACAGWLVYMRKNRLDNAQLQVMERAKLYRPRRLVKDPDLITTRDEIEEAEWFI